MESFFNDLGFSYTLGKIIPYALTIALGILLFVAVKKMRLRIWLSYALSFIGLLLPFCLYFAFSPIYEGDFSENGKPIAIRSAKTSEFKNGLLVLAQPGCPYCFESTFMLNQLKRNYPEVNIEFCLMGTDDRRNMLAIQDYLDEGIQLSMETGEVALLREAVQSFPTFVIVKDGKAIEAYTNNDFGVRAKDKVVSLFGESR